jgi:predicted Rossmann fold nucleotide-binding protein DprA/Smf involved in DNA uptake
LLDVNQEISAENFFDQDLQDKISENNSYKNQSIEIDKISQDILSKINNYPISIDEIIFQLNISPKLVNIALVQLELNKRIIVFQGKVSLEIT